MESFLFHFRFIASSLKSSLRTLAFPVVGSSCINSLKCTMKTWRLTGSLRKPVPLLHTQTLYAEVSLKPSSNCLNEMHLNCDRDFDWIWPEKSVAVIIWKSPGRGKLCDCACQPFSSVDSNWYGKLKSTVCVVVVGLNICFRFCCYLELPAVNSLKKCAMLFCLFMGSSWKCENCHLVEYIV